MLCCTLYLFKVVFKMSKYSERIQEILKTASGKKVLDKKKCVLDLLELYENQEALNEICINSEQNVQGVINWSYIIHTVHKVVLNETDRHASKDSYGRAIIIERQNTCLLMRKTVQYANSYKIPLLKCSDIIPLILQILGTSIYEYYHETYMHILVLYVLPLRTYHVKMLPEQWQELLKICILLYKNVSSIVNKRTTLEALQMIAHYGCLYSDLLPNLKETPPFLETVFLDVKTNQEILAESAYKLAHTVCRQIAIECRHNLCQFSENVLPNIISLKSSIEKYKLLLLFNQIHHPKGICKVDDGAYASNWEKWCAILKSMYLMILKDLKADVLPKSFTYLASEVFKQILENTDIVIERTSLDESDCINVVKKRRIASKMDGLIDIISGNNSEEAWPRIQILTVLLKKYPECLKSHDLAEFLKILVNLLTQSCKEEIIMDNLYDLCAILLTNEKILSTTCIENSNIYWDKIWDILLRSLNVNQNEISTHKLTQLFIINNKITKPNVLLRLYLTNVIKWSVMSLRTLIILCKYLSLPSDITMFNINTCSPTMNSDSVRLCLLKWALNIPWHKLATEIVIDELCLLLISITSKSKYEKQIEFKENSTNNSCDCLNNEELSYEEIENAYLLLKYKTNLFIDKEKDDIHCDIKLNEKILYMQDIVTSLQVQLCNTLDEGSGNDDIYIRIIKIAIVAKVISMMKQLNMINNDEIFLQQTMKTHLNSVYTLLANIDPSKSKYTYLCNVTKALNILYGTLYDTEISKIIILSSTPEMLRNTFSLMNIEDNEIADYETTKDYYENYSSFQIKRRALDQNIQEKWCNFCDKGTIRIQTSKALALFCCMNVGEEKCEIQRKLMDNLLKIDMYDLSRTFNFKMAVTVLESLLNYDKQNLSKNHGETPLKDVLALYQECREDETAVRYIFNILPYFLRYAVDYNFYLDDLINIISQQNRHKKKYGFRVHIEITKCILRIIHISPTLLYYIVPNEVDHMMPIMDSILSSLTNSLFIVQLEAIKCIREIYLSKKIDFKWKEILFMQIENSINKLVISSQSMCVDESETRIAGALLGLIAIVFSNGTFQCRALLTMLHFIMDKKIDIQIIPRALGTITNQIRYISLIEDNLSYLITCWYNSRYSSESFPWQLVQCSSEEQFYETHINMLAFIKFQSFKLSNVASLCNYVTLSFQQIIENIFPQVIPWLLYCINEDDDSGKKKLAGDSDAIRGTGSSHLQDHSTRIQHYLAQDVELSFGNMSVNKEIAYGPHQSGFQNLLDNMIYAMSTHNEKVDEDIQYECAWRLGNWNFSVINQAQSDCKLKSQIVESDYHFYHYQALKYFHEGNEIGIQNAIGNARISIVKALKNISLESSKTVYEKLMQLQLIREIEELSSAKPDEHEKVLQKWQQQDISNFNELQYIEPILTQRTIMYQINNALVDSVQMKDALYNTYLNILKIAADKENLRIATRSLAALAKQTDLPPKVQDQMLYQESLLARLRNDLEIGRFLLRNLMHKDTLDTNLRAQVLRVYGDWMAETKSENPQTVIEEYYMKSVDASTSINEQTADSIKNLHNTQVALARFADVQYEQICAHMKSPQFESLKECITSTEEVSALSMSKDKDVRRAFILNHKQNINDAAELKHIQKERDNYLTLALQYYLLVLQQSEDYNLLIFRIVALWLDNIKQTDVNHLLNENLQRIPSFKFIPLIPQLAAHINNVSDAFSEKIYSIMEHCALEHPHHTLPVLLALKNLYGDYEYSTTQANNVVEPRVLGARKLLQELTRTNIRLIVHEMEKLSHSLVMLANLETSTRKPGSMVNIPKNQEILKVKNFNNVLVPTLTINVKSSRNYNNIIGISKYSGTYETVGGLNTPKKIICIGTDGISRYQLVKGKDDLRQDAVMQQVFSVMNILLKAYKETKRRKLMIRTYKVVPLTQRSGILEWCDNTVPIIFILIGSNPNSGFHVKYYPKDYTAKDCRDKLSAVEKASTDAKLKAFTDCCAHMHPVLHHFFMEKYPSPETWFERRLAYTRSIATTSIAGYILGLGDRHLNNILLDQTTAEVIHIDFGIAFEQGKVLPIPETIPFRLTQNIEAAMGVSGIEGTMRQCCEKTLTVLRDQRQIIITLLQVLLYDPLFTWTITPAKARNIQSGSSSKQVEINQSSTGTNKTAGRALLRIEQKLQGTEEGLASSISGQVERLIQQARDPMNLSRIYCGWQPYL
ncbi:serine/threonine-protein kinase tefu isoform X5 [Lasioglossum baleicum]|uniref:serine/threonine-protein kinase tefu isoform X5 n=1 Tax=Lasioglossum baleicum TaxID=434251 RepID=UPI003FCE0FA4